MARGSLGGWILRILSIISFALAGLLAVGVQQANNSGAWFPHLFDYMAGEFIFVAILGGLAFMFAAKSLNHPKTQAPLKVSESAGSTTEKENGKR